MTTEEIVRMAREAGGDDWGIFRDFMPELERFAKLVAAAERNRTWTQDHWTEYERSIAAAEREACAQLCENMTLEWGDQPGIAQAELATMMDCALAIRNRGQS